MNSNPNIRIDMRQIIKICCVMMGLALCIPTLEAYSGTWSYGSNAMNGSETYSSGIRGMGDVYRSNEGQFGGLNGKVGSYTPFAETYGNAYSGDNRALGYTYLNGMTVLDDNTFFGETGSGETGTELDGNNSSGNVDTPLTMPHYLFAFLLLGYVSVLFIKQRHKSTT